MQQQLSDFEIIKSQMQDLRLFLIEMLKQTNPEGYLEYMKKEGEEINLTQNKK